MLLLGSFYSKRSICVIVEAVCFNSTQLITQGPSSSSFGKWKERSTLQSMNTRPRRRKERNGSSRLVTTGLQIIPPIDLLFPPVALARFTAFIRFIHLTHVGCGKAGPALHMMHPLPCLGKRAGRCSRFESRGKKTPSTFCVLAL